MWRDTIRSAWFVTGNRHKSGWQRTALHAIFATLHILKCWHRTWKLTSIRMIIWAFWRCMIPSILNSHWGEQGNLNHGQAHHGIECKDCSQEGSNMPFESYHRSEVLQVIWKHIYCSYHGWPDSSRVLCFRGRVLFARGRKGKENSDWQIDQLSIFIGRECFLSRNDNVPKKESGPIM